MSSFPEQNDPHYSKKIPLICSKFRFSDYISIILSGCPPLGLIKPRGGHPSKIHVSTVRIRLPDRKVLFDSFVKRKLRLPMSKGRVLFLEFFRIYSIKKKCVMFTKKLTSPIYRCGQGVSEIFFKFITRSHSEFELEIVQQD